MSPLALGNTSITASAAGYQPGSASVAVVTPAIAVTFNNSASSVPVMQSIGGTITLSAPAPPGGTSVTLVDVQDYDAGQTPGLVTFNPTSVVIPAGSTTGTFTMTGAAVGPVEILPGAPGYPRVNFIPFNVTLGSVAIPNNLSVPTGQSVPLNIQLSSPAPVNGVTITLQSGNAGILTISPTTVTIGAGATTPSVAPQVTGVAVGSTTITASSTGYSGDTETVNVTNNVALSLPCPAVAAGDVNAPFSSQVSAVGGVTPYTYSVIGTLPSGLALNPSTGAITGTPTVSGNFSIQVKDATGNTAASCTLSISGPLSLPCPATTSGQANAPFSSQVSAVGGVTPYTYSVIGTLPNGLTLNPSTGAITGTPTVSGNFSIQVKDATGNTAASCTLSISGPLSLPCPATTSGEVNSPFSSQLSASGGVTPYTYSVVGTLPNGLTLNPSTRRHHRHADCLRQLQHPGEGCDREHRCQLHVKHQRSALAPVSGHHVGPGERAFQQSGVGCGGRHPLYLLGDRHAAERTRPEPLYGRHHRHSFRRRQLQRSG